MGLLSSVVSLNLHSNMLNGTLPSEIGNLSRLEFLFVAQNRLTGTIPDEYSSLSLLRKVVIGQNRLSGTIPLDLCLLREWTPLTFDAGDVCGRFTPWKLICPDAKCCPVCTTP